MQKFCTLTHLQIQSQTKKIIRHILHPALLIIQSKNKESQDVGRVQKLYMVLGDQL